MTDADPVAAALAERREMLAEAMRAANVSREVMTWRCGLAAGVARAALAALDAVLAPHKPRTDRIPGRSCVAHRPLKPVPDCPLCDQDQQRQVCPECRDEFGDPVPFGDCRARKAALAALRGEGEAGGRQERLP